MNRNIDNIIDVNLFKEYAETVWVYLKASNTLDENYDPYLNIGQAVTEQSPEPVKAIVRQISADSLIMREIGLTNSGAIELIIKKQDLGLFKICRKAIYNDEDYSVNIDVLGTKVQFYKHLLDYYRVVLYKVGN